jgi:hypothetical protein
LAVGFKKGGKKVGGRKAGTPNKRTVALRDLVDKALARGETPVEFMLRVMRGQCVKGERDWTPEERLDAAKAVAPYVHPKLATIEHTGPGGSPVDSRVSVEVVFVDPERS